MQLKTVLGFGFSSSIRNSLRQLKQLNPDSDNKHGWLSVQYHSRKEKNGFHLGEEKQEQLVINPLSYIRC